MPNRTTCFTVLIASSLCWIGCSTSSHNEIDPEFESKFVGVSVGDLKVDVEIKLGTPYAKLRHIEEGKSLLEKSPDRFWVYLSGDYGYVVTFANGKVEDKKKMEPDECLSFQSRLRDEMAEARIREPQLVEDVKKFENLMIAINQFHDVHKKHPWSDDHNSGLSWRVKLLPFLGKDAQYERFKRDEAWDSDFNRKLISVDVKKLFVASSGNLITAPSMTDDIGSVDDGTNNTLGLIENPFKKVDEWTKPDRLPSGYGNRKFMLQTTLDKERKLVIEEYLGVFKFFNESGRKYVYALLDGTVRIGNPQNYDTTSLKKLINHKKYRKPVYLKRRGK